LAAGVRSAWLLPANRRQLSEALGYYLPKRAFLLAASVLTLEV